jgi:hypothetical protein
VWSVPLAAIGLATLYLSGKPRYTKTAWRLGVLDEIVWCIYAIATEQYPFLLSAAAYGAVYVRHLRDTQQKGNPMTENTAPNTPRATPSAIRAYFAGATLHDLKALKAAPSATGTGTAYDDIAIGLGSDTLTY